ncbi:hypothetical protein F511_41679 [Dorcoceras hygrometricum]|uniref:Uncharacterized protein n=1 Tax=Dorcoceras hygrometricum TaxID=472368 RepID=A0A2Z6ZZR5_9LAMI|nr:hypothetical protein F511_41679 [Dorcoceras hygrometricum]
MSNLVKDKPARIEENQIRNLVQAGCLREMGLLWKMEMEMKMRKNLIAGCTRSVSIGPAGTEKSQAGSDKKKSIVADQIGRELQAIEKMPKLKQ